MSSNLLLRASRGRLENNSLPALNGIKSKYISWISKCLTVSYSFSLVKNSLIKSFSCCVLNKSFRSLVSGSVLKVTMMMIIIIIIIIILKIIIIIIITA